MAKVYFEQWKFPIDIAFETKEGYSIKGHGWYKTTSEHGKSKGEVNCPCCGGVTEIYIWSFMGGGKRCGDCKVHLGSQGAWLNKAESDGKVVIEDNVIIDMVR